MRDAWRGAWFVIALGLCAGPAVAQAPAPPALLDAMQLDQLLAPIALYPDELLGPILMAAGYPLEIVEADRWLQDPANAALRGGALALALQRQPWDASVKTLVTFPQVLGALDNNLDWTEAVGDAFVAQQAQVMDRIQQLRARALAARTLVSSPQQVVRDLGQEIEIHPPGADMVYAPEYDPNVVYGTWPYADDPPADFELPGFVAGGYIGFVILGPYWGWSTWDWPRHRLGVVPPGAAVAPGSGAAPRWHHDPGRRRRDSVHASAEIRALAARTAVHAALPGVAPRARAPASVPIGLPTANEVNHRADAARPSMPLPSELRGVPESQALPPRLEGPARPNPQPVREAPRSAVHPAEPVEGEHGDGGHEHR
jgi:hypothetical protein